MKKYAILVALAIAIAISGIGIGSAQMGGNCEYNWYPGWFVVGSVDQSGIDYTFYPDGYPPSIYRTGTTSYRQGITPGSQIRGYLGLIISGACNPKVADF